MYVLKMKLSGSVRGLPMPSGVITRRFASNFVMTEYLHGLLNQPGASIVVELMSINQE